MRIKFRKIFIVSIASSNISVPVSWRVSWRNALHFCSVPLFTKGWIKRNVKLCGTCRVKYNDFTVRTTYVNRVYIPPESRWKWMRNRYMDYLRFDFCLRHGRRFIAMVLLSLERTNIYVASLPILTRISFDIWHLPICYTNRKCLSDTENFSGKTCCMIFVGIVSTILSLFINHNYNRNKPIDELKI